MTPEASGWHITRVTPAGIVEPAVPAASESPFGPGRIIAIFAVGISRFPGRTIDALGLAARAGACVPGRCGPCCQGKSHDSAENSEFHHAFLRSRDNDILIVFRGAVQIIEMAQHPTPQPALQVHFFFVSLSAAQQSVLLLSRPGRQSPLPAYGPSVVITTSGRLVTRRCCVGLLLDILDDPQCGARATGSRKRGLVTRRRHLQLVVGMFQP